MIPWLDMNIIDLIALLMLPIFSLIGVCYFGQMVKAPWQKVFVWLFGYGVIALTIATTLLNVNFLARVVLRIGYYPVSVELICSWITYDAFPFLSLFYFLSIAKSKKNKILIASVVFAVLLFLLTVLHGWLNQPMR